MENPIKIDDLGVPLFSETAICSSDFQQKSRPFHHHEDYPVVHIHSICSHTQEI